MSDQVLSINFGPSEYVRRAPNTPYIDSAFEFSTKELEAISFRDKISGEITVAEIMNFDDSRKRTGEKVKAITIPLLGENGCTEKSIKLVHLKGEWIAFEHYLWTEGSHLPDETYNGPFLPNFICNSIIAKHT